MRFGTCLWFQSFNTLGWEKNRPFDFEKIIWLNNCVHQYITDFYETLVDQIHLVRKSFQRYSSIKYSNFFSFGYDFLHSFSFLHFEMNSKAAVDALLMLSCATLCRLIVVVCWRAYSDFLYRVCQHYVNDDDGESCFLLAIRHPSDGCNVELEVHTRPYRIHSLTHLQILNLHT